MKYIWDSAGGAGLGFMFHRPGVAFGRFAVRAVDIIDLNVISQCIFCFDQRVFLFKGLHFDTLLA